MTLEALANAEAALAQLVAFVSEPVRTDRDRAGVIQAFEFTFEAAWKLLKHRAAEEGLDAESPRRAILAGYKIGFVNDEVLWLEMLHDRNQTTHVYHHQVADRIYQAIKTRYASALSETIRLAGENANGGG